MRPRVGRGLRVAREEQVAVEAEEVIVGRAGPLRRRYCQRACTFTRGNSGGLPSRSTTRRMPSVDSIKRFWFEKLRILPHDLGSATSYLAVAVCASARYGASVASHELTAMATRATAITVSTAFR